MTKGEQAVARARAFLGTRFTAQGRDPAIGLDCVGLTLLVYEIGAAGARDDYRLTGTHRRAILHFAEAHFRRVARPRRRAGDLLLLQPGAKQWHLGVWTGDGLIHADIINRQIVERPGQPDWHVAAALRPRVRPAKGS